MAKTDQAVGRIKQAAGDLTGNKDLKREGKVDEHKGSLKERLTDAVDALSDRLKGDHK